jgi:hypothetical protein
MSVLIAVVLTLVWSGIVAWVAVRVPRIGLGNHPRAALVVASVGVFMAGFVVWILVGSPGIFGMALSDWWPNIVTNYFMAMAHRLIDGPYPFFWTPPWMYPVGSLALLIPVGATLAIVAGYCARPYARRAAVVIVAVSCCLLAAYVAAGAFAVMSTWGGVPL